MYTINTHLKKNKGTNGIQEIAYAFQQSRVLFTACELDVFTVLGNDKLSAEEIAAKINCDAGALEKLLNAVCSIGLMEKDNSLYSNTLESLMNLVKGSPEYLGNLMHVASLWNTWGNLTETVRKGKPPEYHDISDKDKNWVETYIMSGHWKVNQAAVEVAEMIPLAGVSKFLDLGAGSGLYTMEFLKQKPGMKAVCYDLPSVIPHTKKHLELADLQGKVETIAGDFMQGDIGTGYDLVFVSEVIQAYSIWENIKLMQRVFDSLNPGGKVVINETIVSDDRTSPQRAAMLSINMLVNTMNGDAYTETDLWIILKESWFSDIYRMNTNFNTSLVIGTKPGRYF